MVRPPLLSRMPARPTLRLLLLAVGAELLEIGPKVGDVLVVLDSDERHASAGHLLHRRADVLGEGLVGPGDAGILVGLGIIEAVHGAGLAAVEPVLRRSELDPRLLPDVMAGRAQSLEHRLA